MRTCWIPTLVLAATAAFSGCTQLSPHGQKMLQDCYDATEKNDNAAALAKLDKFVEEYGKTDRGDEGYYLRGVAQYRAGQRDKAKADFAKALDLTNKAELRGKANLALGDIAAESDDVKTAEECYRKALEDIPNDRPPADRAFFRCGVALQRMGKWDDARVMLFRVMDMAKDSSWAKEARRRVNASSWTVQAGAFRNNAAAEAVLRRLKAAGIPAETRAVPEEGMIFVVQSGAYATYEEAAQALRRVQQVQKDAFVAPK